MSTTFLPTVLRKKAVPGTDDEAEFRDLVRVSAVLGALTALGLLLTFVYGVRASGWTFQPHLLWALALWALGTAAGFLFAIPKVLQRDRPAPAAAPPASGGSAPSATDPGSSQSSSSAVAYQQRVNTNLEEISDWLTKIIVGTGLIELRNLDEYVYRLGQTIVAGLPAPTNPSFGMSIALFFLGVGFLFGYLVTRLYIQGALARAERGLARAEVQTEARTDLEVRLVAASTTIEALREIAPPSAVATAAATRGAALPNPQVEKGIRELSQEYMGISIADWRTRLAAKNQAAAKMVKYVVDNGVSRDWLAEQSDEGLTLALAATIQASPAPGDCRRLLKFAGATKRLHVQYRIVLAFLRLHEERLVAPDERPQILAVLDSYEKGADASLSDLIKSARRQFAASA